MTSLQKSFEKAVHTIIGRDRHDLILFTLRHGESIGQRNASTYKTLGDDAVPLTRHGVRQAVAVGKILTQICLKAGIAQIDIRTSSGERASTTALLIHEVMNGTMLDYSTRLEVGLAEDRRLDKQKFGQFDGYFTSAERQVAVPDAYEQYLREEKPKGEFRARPPGGESLEDVRERVKLAIDEYRESHVPIVSVTHGTNTLCEDDVLTHKGEEWILQNIDKRPNCSIDLYYGSLQRGFKHQAITSDPLVWVDQSPGWNLQI